MTDSKEFRHPLISIFLWSLPDQIPPADWTRPCWRHDPTSGRWTDLLPCDQTKAKEEHFNLKLKGRENGCRRDVMSLTPPLLHLTLTLMASEIPFSARPRPLPVCSIKTVELQCYKMYFKTHDRLPPCSQPWRRSCCSANFKPRLFSWTISAIWRWQKHIEYLVKKNKNTVAKTNELMKSGAKYKT